MVAKDQHSFLLSELLVDFLQVTKNYDRVITGLAIDSREVSPDCLFFAYPGFSADGRDYITKAIEQGATAILCEGESGEMAMFADNLLGVTSVPILYLNDLAAKVGLIAAKFYAYPSQHLTVIGVTGTNGKTSCTHLLARALKKEHKPCGIVGTLGIGFPDQLLATNTTTPDPITLQKSFVGFLADGAKAVAMEVSSHRLAQNRLQGIDFGIGVFTNLTRDHLDYHETMEKYWQAKRSLFLDYHLKHAVINADDKYGYSLFADLVKAKETEVFAYSITDIEVPKNIPITRANNVKLDEKGCYAEITSPWGDGILQSILLGRFYISNLLAVLNVLCLMGISFRRALAAVNQLGIVPGRMQVIGGDKMPLVVVDYSHTPDALEKALIALREHCRGKLWCVFGCGGDRDRGKRPLMAAIAERHSDQVIVTNDNPRTEDPQQIFNDIMPGFLCPWAVEIEPDREVAIYHAIDCAQPGDVILLAGKGHEDYQIIGKNKIPFSDLVKAEEALACKSNVEK
jgi:UDP-N-acetylmuramoyl-L-alanyl-D-glutamate--2,6-diaminopimelate ligase